MHYKQFHLAVPQEQQQQQQRQQKQEQQQLNLSLKQSESKKLNKRHIHQNIRQLTVN